MIKFWIVVIPVLMTVCPFALFAGQAMTRSDCVKKAYDDNPDIKSAKSTLSSNEYKAKASYSNFLPQVSGDVNYN